MMKMISSFSLPGGRGMWGCLQLLYSPRWFLPVAHRAHLWRHLDMCPMFLSGVLIVSPGLQSPSALVVGFPLNHRDPSQYTQL